MNVTPDHWLEGATRIPYPKGPAMDVRRFAVAHFTSGASGRSSIEFWGTPEAKGAEAHVVIDRDGSVLQVRPFDQQADHAGRSQWKCPNTGRMFYWLNKCSIGIEFANAGDDMRVAKQCSKLSFVRARHKNGGPEIQWEAYPVAQILAGIEVFRAIVKRYNLDDLVGHDDIAPDRKNDPGPAFPMQRVREACGFSGLPGRHT